MADLITSEYAIQQIGGSLPPGYSSVLAGAISAASSAVQRYCGRDFVATDYDEVYSGLGYSAIQTRQYPVIQVTRLSIGLQTVLTVANNNSSLNQRAVAYLTDTGTGQTDPTSSGITLVRVASSVTTTDTSTTFASYPTVQAAADHINGLGNGWTATPATGYTLWPSADLRAVQGAQGALASQGGIGAQFQAFTTDLTCYTVDALTGRIQMNSQQWDPIFAHMNLGASPLVSTFPPSFDGLRIQYRAGYSTIPYDVQQATLLTTQALVWQSMRPSMLKSETAKDYSYELNDLNGYSLPEPARQLLLPWRAYRRY